MSVIICPTLFTGLKHAGFMNWSINVSLKMSWHLRGKSWELFLAARRPGRRVKMFTSK